MKPFRASRWLFLVPVLAFLAGCGASSGKPKVAFVSNNPEEFWNIVEAGCRKGEAESGVELIFRRPDQGDAANQKGVIDTLVNQGVKAIAISVIDPKNQADYLDSIASRIPLLAVDNDAPKTKRAAYVGTDNYSAGRAVGKLVKEAMPDGGTIAIFVGQLEPLNARQRRQGVIDEIAGRDAPKDVTDFTPSPDGETYGKYKFHKRTYLDQPEGAAKAKENAATALGELADVENVCMVGLWAYNPPAILSALTDLKEKAKSEKDKARLEKVKIVAFDEMDATLDGIRDGHIYATVVQQPFEFGYRSAKLMADLVKNPDKKASMEKLQYVPYRIIAKEAGPARDGEPKREPVEAFRAELKKMLGK